MAGIPENDGFDSPPVSFATDDVWGPAIPEPDSGFNAPPVSFASDDVWNSGPIVSPDDDDDIAEAVSAASAIPENENSMAGLFGERGDDVARHLAGGIPLLQEVHRSVGGPLTGPLAVVDALFGDDIDEYASNVVAPEDKKYKKTEGATFNALLHGDSAEGHSYLGTLGTWAGETLATSAPDMLAMMAGPLGASLYALSSINEGATERAKNDGRTELTNGDLLGGIAVAATRMGSFGVLKQVFKAGGGKAILGLMPKNVWARIGVAGLAESFAEGGEIAATDFLTEKGLTWDELTTNMIEGLGGGLLFGSGAAAGGAAAKKLVGDKEADPIDPVDSESGGAADTADAEALDAHSGAAEDAEQASQSEALGAKYTEKLNEIQSTETSILSNGHLEFIRSTVAKIKEKVSEDDQEEAIDELLRSLDGKFGVGTGKALMDHALDPAKPNPIPEEGTAATPTVKEEVVPPIDGTVPPTQPAPDVTVPPTQPAPDVTADQNTVMESQEEIDSQVSALKAGTKPAVLFNNGETVEDVKDLLKRRGIKLMNVVERPGIGIVAYKKGAKTADGRSVGQLLHPQNGDKHLGAALGYGAESDANYAANKANPQDTDAMTMVTNADGTLAQVMEGGLTANQDAAAQMYPEGTLQENTRAEATAQRGGRDAYNVNTDPTVPLTPEQQAAQSAPVETDGTAQSAVDSVVDAIDNKSLFNSKTRTGKRGNQVAMNAATLRDQLYDVIGQLKPVLDALAAEGKDTTPVKHAAMNALMNSGSMSMEKAADLTWEQIAKKLAHVTSLTHGKSRVPMAAARNGAERIKAAMAASLKSESRPERTTGNKPTPKATKPNKAKPAATKPTKKTPAKENTTKADLLAEQERIFEEAAAAATKRGETTTTEQTEQAAENDAKAQTKKRRFKHTRTQLSLIVAGIKAYRDGDYTVAQIKALIKLIDPGAVPTGALTKGPLTKILDGLIAEFAPATPTTATKPKPAAKKETGSKALWQTLDQRREDMHSKDATRIAEAQKYIHNFIVVLTGQRELSSKALRDAVPGTFNELTYADMRSIIRRVLMGEPIDTLTDGQEVEFANQISKLMDEIIPEKSIGERAKTVDTGNPLSRDLEQRLKNAIPGHVKLVNRVIRLLKKKSTNATDINDFMGGMRRLMDNAGTAKEFHQQLLDLGITPATALQLVDNITVASEILVDRGAVAPEDAITARKELEDKFSAEVVAEQENINEEETDLEKKTRELLEEAGIDPSEFEVGDSTGTDAAEASQGRNRNVHGELDTNESGDMIDENDYDSAHYSRIDPDDNPVGEAVNSPLFKYSKRWAKRRMVTTAKVLAAAAMSEGKFTSKQAMEILAKQLPMFDPLRMIAKAMLALDINVPMAVGIDGMIDTFGRDRAEELINKNLVSDGEFQDGIGGFHSTIANLIYINDEHEWGNTLVAIVHETVHAATVTAMRINPEFRLKVRDLRRKVNRVLFAGLDREYTELRDQYGMSETQANRLIQNIAQTGEFETKYGMQDDLEFLAVGLSDPGFMQLLGTLVTDKAAATKLAPKLREIFNEFVSAINRMLGLPDVARSALGELLNFTMTYSVSSVEEYVARLDIGQLDTDMDATYEAMRQDDIAKGNTSPAQGFTDEEAADLGWNKYQDQFSKMHPSAPKPTRQNWLKQKAIALQNMPAGKMRYALGFMLTHTIVDAWGDTVVDISNKAGKVIQKGVTPIKDFVKVRRQIRVDAEKYIRDKEASIIAAGQRLQENYPQHEDTFADLITEATMFDVDPSKAFPNPKPTTNKITGVTKPGKKTAKWKTKKTAHARIQAVYNSLPQEHRNYFKAVQKTTRDAAIESRKLSIDSMGQQWGVKQYVIDQLKAATTQKDLDAMQVPKVTKMVNGVATRVAMPAKQWAQRKITVQQMNVLLNKEFYFPLMRFGSHSVSATRDYTSPAYTSKKKARAASVAWASEEGGRKAKGVKKVNGKWQFKGEQELYMQIEAADMDATRAVLEKGNWDEIQIGLNTEYNDEADKAKLANTALEMARGNKVVSNKDLMKFVVSMSAAGEKIQRQMRRNNTLGSTADIHRALANYITGEGWSQAAIKHSNALNKATNNMRYMARSTSNLPESQRLRISQVVNELIKRTGNDTVTGPAGQIWSRLAGQFGFLNNLASLSYPLINLTQTMMITTPQLIGEYGYGATIKEMSKAYYTLVRTPIKALYKSGAGVKELPGLRSIKGFKGDTLAAMGTNQELANISNVVPRMILDLENTVANTTPGTAEYTEAKHSLAALKTVQESGLIESTLSKMIQQVATSNTAHSSERGVRDAIVDGFSVMPFLAEIVNRSTTAVATYKLEYARAKNTGMTDAQAAKSAAAQTERVTSKTQIDYSGDNRARVLQENELVRVAMMFKIYPMALASWMYEHTYKTVTGGESFIKRKNFTNANGVFDETSYKAAKARRKTTIKDTEVRRKSAKTLGAFTAVTFLVSGASGVALSGPLSVFTNMISAIFGGPDEDDDLLVHYLKFYGEHPELAMHEVATTLFYKWFPTMSDEDVKMAATMLVEGGPGPWMDLGSRIGTKDMFFMPAREDAGAFESHLTQAYDFALGPIFGAGKGYTSAFAALEAGAGWMEAAKRAAPKGLKDILKGISLAKKGMTNFNGDTLIDAEDLKGTDVLVRMIGFTTGTERDVYTRRNRKLKSDTEIKKGKARAMRMYRNYVHSGDKSDKVKAISAAREFNKTLSRGDLKNHGLSIKKLRANALRQQKKERNLTSEYGVQFKKNEQHKYNQYNPTR